MLQDEINKAKRLLQDLEHQQSRCEHVWGKTVYDPYEGRKEYTTSRLIGHGSDPYPEVAYRDVMKDRWTRTCTKCGFPQHTEKQKDVSKPQHVPDFKD